MVEEALQRAIVGEAGLALVPQALRQAMLSDPDFLENFGLSLHTDGTVSFNNGPKFQASELYARTREADDSAEPLFLDDKQGKQWRICIGSNDEGRECPRIAQGDQSIDWLEGALLLKDKATRLRAFQEMAVNVALPESDRTHWVKALAKRPFSATDMGYLLEDLDDTPNRFVDRLSNSLRLGETPVDLFIPRNRRYYERLVGKLGGASTLNEHAQGGASENAERLITWDQRDGLLLALAMASHSEFSSIIPLEKVAKEIAAEVFDLLVEYGDMISRLGAIQAAIPLLGERPDLVGSVEKLIKIISLENPETHIDGFSDLCRLFIFVDSEISRLGLMRGDPPFFRRMASFAHASLIQRQLLIEGADLTDFRNWIDHSFGPQFYSQSLVDMRDAPRWHPDLIHPDQLKQEFIGRLFGSSETFNQQVGEANLTELVSPTSDHKDSLASVAESLKPYFPGPLEGNISPSQRVPEDMLAIIDEQLNEAELSSKSFVAAVNLANVFMIEEDLAARISEILKNGRYHLHKVEDVGELAGVLSGLAKIAAVTRSVSLAQDVRVLVQKYRSDASFKISIPDAYRTIFFAASAYTGLEDWCIFVGDSLRQLAFGSLTKDEAEELRALIKYVCVAEPELWTTVGIADAALSAFAAS
ncbi:MAG: hypothetical protein JJ877_06010 [Thalassococcus sp.]|uniref:hypothetical protein n=1 Tax=Thalassococcus sp. TaxID=1928858 RepID=UPI001B1CACD9|nr:hypothetical protein [Thalassococcus sp.]MBO6866580.1 hypothetical protein [Thalassococcus sp.]